MLTRIIALPLFAGLAVLSFTQALGMVAARFSPAVALNLIPKNGLAMADVALALAVSAAVPTAPGQATKAPDREWLQLAMRAQASEPLAHDAVSAAALYYAALGDRDRARTLMKQSLAVTRRDKAANVWLIQDYARQRNIDGVLKHVDLAQRSSQSTGSVLNPLLANALAQSDSVEPFVRLLRDQPPWAEDFWAAALKNDAALINAARLRTALARRGEGIAGEADAVLTEKLVDTGSFATAFDLRESLASAGQRAESAIVNGDFAAEPFLAPIDWALRSEGDLGADILPGSGAMLVSAVPGSRGIAARQLIRLDPGLHEIRVALKESPLPQTSLELALHCANGGRNAARVFSQQLAGRETVRAFTTSAVCDYYWLEFVVSIPEGADADDVMVTGIALDGPMTGAD